MDFDQAKRTVIEAVGLALGDATEVTFKMELIGGASAIDSMKLVEICLSLEDSAEEFGFEFD